MPRSAIIEAFKALEEKAKTEKNAKDQFDVAFAYHVGRFSGNYIERSDEKAAYWYRQAAEQNDVWSQTSLAFYYLQNGNAEQRIEAVSWHQKAANAGQPWAQANLGNCLYNGIGTEKNSSKAILWLCRAVNNRGNKEAKEWLREGSFTGRYNVEFRESDENTSLTKPQILEVIEAMKSVGRAKTNESTIIGKLVSFSVKKGAITTVAELVEILTALTKDNSGLDPTKSKSYLMIDRSRQQLITDRSREEMQNRAATRAEIPEAAEASGTGVSPSASARRSSATKITGGHEATRS
jgi:TPR repeat protein